MNAIPTVVNGLRFRSRLEATWGEFCSLLHWPWEYEPFDLDGYIPDFVLKFKKPMLVEVKPCIYRDELYEHTHKIDASGWDHEALIVGATIFQEGSQASIGILRQKNTHIGWDPGDPESYNQWCWAPADMMICGHCKFLSFYHRDWLWNCRVCNFYDGDKFLRPNYDRLLQIWNRAKNNTQWHANTGR